MNNVTGGGAEFEYLLAKKPVIVQEHNYSFFPGLQVSRWKDHWIGSQEACVLGSAPTQSSMAMGKSLNLTQTPFHHLLNEGFI